MSRSDLILLAVAFAALLAHALVFHFGRRIPRWTLLLAATLGLGLSCGALVVSALALWKPALVASWGAVAHLQHPALFATGLALVSLGGANWFGRAWHLRRQGGWAVFGRGLLGLIQMAVAAALLVAGLVWLMGHMGDPGPKGYQERYGEHGSSAPSWPRPTSVRTPSL